MAILKKTIPFILPLLLTSCYESFDPKIDTTPVLCLNSLITAGSPIEVKVSRTWVYTDREGEKDHSVDDAVVHIYADGVLVDSRYIHGEGDHIRISASSARYGEAEAEVTVPVATRISGVEVSDKVESLWITDTPGWGINADLQFDIAISMKIADPEDADNFHILSHDTFDQSHASGFSSGYFETLDPVFYEQASAFEDVMNGGGHELFFSDRLLNRETGALDFGFKPCFFTLKGWHGDISELECGWDITLYSISESYYKWLTFCWQSGGIVFGDMLDWGLAEPIWGYSNVSTGAGVVAAQSSVTVRIDINDLLLNDLLPVLPSDGTDSPGRLSCSFHRPEYRCPHP